MKFLAMLFVFALVACGSINVPSTAASSSTATDTGTGTDLHADVPPAGPVATPATTAPTAPATGATASASASCTAFASAGAAGGAAAVALPPQIAFGGDPKTWTEATAAVPAGYHLPTRGELVELSDTGIFTEKTGAWWTATESNIAGSAWVFSPDSGFLGTTDKTTTAKVVYIEGLKP